MGLMQVMPATGKWIAAQLKASEYRPSHLADVAVNTGFGAFYLRTVSTRWVVPEPMAAASYNAGPGRARAWRCGYAAGGRDLRGSIPFNETRDYVRRCWPMPSGTPICRLGQHLAEIAIGDNSAQ